MTIYKIFLTSLVLELLAGLMVDAHRESELVRAEIQSLEKALIMKFIENKDAQIQVVACNPKWKRKENFLMKDQLGALTKPNHKRAYIYVPPEFTEDKKELFVASVGGDSGTQHAEDIMYTALNEVPPREYWINKSPCPRCALNLIARYATANVPQPRIMKFFHFYTLPPQNFPGHQNAAVESRQLSLQCMAKMIHHGWQFEPWDWNEFRTNYLTDDECKEYMNTALTNENTKAILEQEREQAIEAINEARRLAGDIPEDQLCQNVPNN